MDSAVPWEPTRLIEALRACSRAITGNAEPTRRYVELAARVREFDAWIRTNSLPAKKTYARLSLDYYLARQALWIDETRTLYGARHPGILELGPSFVLLVREAARRFEREGRAADLERFVRHAVAGVPRSALRREYLPVRSGTPRSANSVTADSIAAALTLATTQGPT